MLILDFFFFFLFNISVLYVCTTFVVNKRIHYSWGATSEYRFEIGDFAPTGDGWPKISGRIGRQPFFFSEHQAKWSFVWYKNLDRSFFRFLTIHALTDGQTNRQNSHR